MEKAEYFEKAAQHIIDANEESAVQLAHEYLDEDLDPAEMIEKGLSEGIRDKLTTMFGGAATTEHWAAKIGATFWAKNAGDTVIKLKEIFS